MGEQTQTQPQIQNQPQSQHHPDSSTTTTATTTQPPPPPPSTDASLLSPPQNSTSSKLPFRPQKIRKLSPDASADNPNPKSTDGKTTSATATTHPNKKSKIVVQQVVRIPPRITARTLSYKGEVELALRHLRSADPQLARLIDLHLPPTFDSFQPPFLALSKSILYQQLAYKAGTSIYTRFVSLCGGESSVLPEAVLSLTPHQLRQIGISARKSSYLHDLANKYRNGILSDTSIVEMDDKSLFTMLTMVKGIGPWSVHMFMIFSLHRPDVLPVGDVGVRKGVQLLYGLEQLPRPSQMEQLCEKWRPYRSVASWYMWRFAEAHGAPATAAAVAVDASQQQQQPPPPLPQIMDPITSIANLG
ncbi:HhH-GPD domain [Macleaya cordata]|uniref:HhH-GPD domain n=1 Tax=Macleaya cordata TaxID=56857 RepID=A0A200Q9A4_MACCD|nr:HhH-GPD domain [Macleaya cordata]